MTRRSGDHLGDEEEALLADILHVRTALHDGLHPGDENQGEGGVQHLARGRRTSLERRGEAARAVGVAGVAAARAATLGLGVLTVLSAMVGSAT